ncbi:hypothetical protein [Crenobacter caeni]|uniref:Uncharacterized protein n=1 Tax=Crenobacter caeni TaxID=2705474 RepID=A0A6B2KTA9_9NEIS|nr:hypothetical protein [Crenobacter caeni]NDV13388.1 hypothetical protein [Crenobacter caeni]
MKKDWRRVWHPLPRRRALCRVRLSPRVPLAELTLCYAYPEGCSVEEAVTGARVREGAETLAGLLARARVTADA